MKLIKFLCISAITFSIFRVSSYAMQDDAFDTGLEKKLQSYMRLSPQELFNFAVKLRKGEVAEYNQNETQKAAFLCFQKVFLRSKNDSDKILLGKAAHNLGTIYYKWKQPQLAVKMYLLGASTGLEASKNNLTKLKQEKILSFPEKANPELAQELENSQRKIANKAVAIINVMDAFEHNLSQQIPQMISTILSTHNKQLGNESPPDLQQIIPLVQNASSAGHLKKIQDNLTNEFLSRVAKENLIPLQKLKEKANKTGINRSDIDEITYEQLQYRTFTSHEISESLFSTDALNENDRVAKEIKKILAQKTLPIFIGRSCEWIMEHFKRRYPNEQFIKLPGSGLYNLNRVDNDFVPITPDEAIEAYKEFLKSFKLSSMVFENELYDSITLVDRTESGDSILALLTLLHEIDNRFDLQGNTVKFIGIVSQRHEGKFKFPTIVVSKSALEQSVKKHDFDQAKTLSRSFDWPHWKNWKTFNFYPTPLAPAQARLKQVEMFCETN